MPGEYRLIRVDARPSRRGHPGGQRPAPRPRRDYGCPEPCNAATRKFQTSMIRDNNIQMESVIGDIATRNNRWVLLPISTKTRACLCRMTSFRRQDGKPNCVTCLKDLPTNDFERPRADLRATAADCSPPRSTFPTCFFRIRGKSSRQNPRRKAGRKNRRIEFRHARRF